jgi:hypothetical protein
MSLAIGIFSDSDGNLDALDAALRLLSDKGAKRFFFAGGRYADLDDWVKLKRDEAKALNDYTNEDFLEDISNFLLDEEQLERPPAFGNAYEFARTNEILTRMADRVLRTPEKGSLQYIDPKCPKKALDMLGETLCCVVHDKNDLDKEDMLNAVLLVHGNAAEPKLVQIGVRYFLTPGMLKGDKPTVGLLEFSEKALKFSAFALTGETVLEGQTIVLAQKKKVSVK